MNPPPRARRRPRSAALAALACILGAASACGRSPSLPDGTGLNILLVSLDTLRADRLGCYGHSRPTSPALDALAADGVRFAHAISQSPWTTPSHMTLMTGLHPSSHKLNQSWVDFAKRHRVLAEGTTTLAGELQRHGYRTLAQVGGASVAGKLGFARGFDEYRERPIKLSEKVFEQLESWFDEPREEPFFVFLHTFEVHAPYHDDRFAGELLTAEQRAAMRVAIRGPGRRGSSDIQRQREFLSQNALLRPEVTSALYDGGVRSADEFLGRVFESMRRRGLLDRTLIAVTSDHGEEFGEHDPSRLYDDHGHSQHTELVHVPLILRLPGFRRPGLVVEPPVGLVDVAPTLLELVGVPVPAEMQGRSLAPLLVSQPAPRRWVLSEATKDRAIEVKALRTARHTYIARFRLGKDLDRSGLPERRLRERLYDRIADPGELDDLSKVQPSTRRQLREAMERLLTSLDTADETSSVELDRDLEESLRALGYL